MRKLIASLWLALTMAGPTLAADWTVALPTALPGGKASIETPLWDFFAEILGPGDRYAVENATAPGRIALIDIPDEESYARARRKAKKFQAENARIYAHLESMASAPAAIDLTGLLRREALNRLDPERPLALLVVGDSVQAFAKEPGFSMRDETGAIRVPSDGHLSAPLAKTPWGLGAEGTDGLRNVVVHLCLVGEAGALTDDAENRLRRFWSLYVRQRGGTLATWSDDLPRCFERFAARVSTPLVDETPNPKDKLLVMREVGEAEVAVETREDGKTVVNGVEVDSFDIFAYERHPTLSGVQVVTGVQYKPADYPETYEHAWCYFSVTKRGVEIKFDLGSKVPGRAPYLKSGTASARSAAGITMTDFEAGKTACQWPQS